MAKTTAFAGLLAGCVLLAAGASPARAAAKVADVLNFKPDFPDVQISTPLPEEYSSCEVKWIAGADCASVICPRSLNWMATERFDRISRRARQT